MASRHRHRCASGSFRPASLLCRNRDADFPGWAARDLATAGFRAQILARDGATPADVL
jgi:hypothetical protein